MPESKGGAFVTILTTVLTVASALGVGYLTFTSTSQKTAAEAELRAREINLEQTKFDATERERYEKSMVTLVAQILSKTDEDRLIGRATLLTLYPDRAEGVLNVIASVVPAPETRATLQAQATAVASLTRDPWVIVAGGDKVLSEAQVEVARASKAGLTGTLYLRSGMYRTVIGPFPTRLDADRANIAVRGALRSDAYPVRLSTWCPSPAQDASGFSRCPN